MDSEEEREIEREYDAIPFLDITIDCSSPESAASGTEEVLRQLFPGWSEDVKISAITDGITNKLFKVKRDLPNLRSSSGYLVTRCLVRVYGENTELFINRDAEIRTMLRLQRHGLAMPVYGRFQNGVCYGYLEGRPFVPEDMVDTDKAPLTAAALARYHCAIKVGGGTHSPILFDVQRGWLAQISERHLAELAAYAREHVLCEAAAPITLERLRQRVDDLQERYDADQGGPYAVAFCHNDLLSGNLLLFEDEARSPPVREVRIIDYEYSGLNYCAWDIGNHFAEMMGFELLLSRLPPDSFLREWVGEYKRNMDALGFGSRNPIPRKPRGRARPNTPQLESSESFTSGLPDVDTFLEHVKGFMEISHLHWGIWSIVQAEFSSNNEFDYRSYAWRKLAHYFKRNP